MIDDLQISDQNGIGTITLNRPAKYNAITSAMWQALPQAVQVLSARPGIRLIVLRGAGGNFAAGADIAEFDIVYGSREAAEAYAGLIAAAMDAIAASPRPIVAVVQGLCIGAGVALILAADICFADEGASFAITPAQLGIAYSFGDTRRLVARVGAAAAKDMLFTARRIKAEEALSLRLIQRLRAASGLDEEVETYAAQLRAASPASIAVAKSFVARAVSGNKAEDDATMSAYLDILEGPDFIEGLAAFKAKRTPNF